MKKNFINLSNIIFLLICISYLYFFVYFPKLNNPNENVRMYMTKAIVDYGTFAIGRRIKTEKGFRDVDYVHGEYGWVNDRALVCKNTFEKPPNCEGTLYSVKAPGVSYLGVPVYFFVKNIYGLFNKKMTKTEIIYFLRLFAIIFPTLIFIFFFHRFLKNYIKDEFLQNAITIGYSIGTMSFTYGQMFAGHQLYAIFLFSGFMLIKKLNKFKKSLISAFFAGFFISYSVVCEYPAFFTAGIISVYFLLFERKLSNIIFYFLGFIPPVFLLLLFHKVCFGSFFTTPHLFLEVEEWAKDFHIGFMGLTYPKLQYFIGSFFTPYNGLFFFSPFLILIYPAIIYFFIHFKKKCENFENFKKEVILSIIIFLYFTLFISSHVLWRGGWTVGPRYITGIVPFTVFAIAVIFNHFEEHNFKFQRFILLPLIILSVVITGLSSAVSQGFSPGYYNPFVEMVIPFIKEGFLPYNIGQIFGLKGVYGAIPFFLILLFFILYISFKGFFSQKRILKGAFVIFIVVFLLIPINLIRSKDKEAIHRANVFLKSIWEPKNK